ncbi:cadherin-like domain-containing protein, partial [Accumulibacter sp.]|uniref:Ig-like domain-containing protein n=1 Tax=Accumulibacter sp. TaxID=2053492 RepID=UPI001AC2F217
PKSGFLAVGEDLWFATEKGGSGNGSIEKLSLPGGTVTWVADLEVATGIKVESFAHDGAGHLYFAPREGGDLAEVGGKGAGTVRRLDLSSRGITTVVTLKNAEHGSKVRNLLFWQGQLWWVCEEGGDLSLEGGKGGGTLMSCDPATGGVQRRHLFDGTTGLKPKGLALAGGDLYFTTEKGGAENLGVFGVARGGTNVSVLQDLGGPTGAKPDHQLSVLGNRLLFATENGGSGFLGTILSYTLPSAPEILTLEVDAQRSHLELAPTVFDGIEFSPGQPQGAGALRAPVGNGLDFKVGQIDTIIGYEVLDSYANPTFSRSLGFNIEPFSHTGMTATYQVAEWLSVVGGVADSAFNGTNQKETYNGQNNDGTITSNGGSGNGTLTYMGAVTLKAPESWGSLAGAALYGGIVSNGRSGYTYTDGDFGMGIQENSLNYYVGVSVPTPIKEITVGAAWDYLSDGNGDASTTVASIDVVNDAPDANADEYFVHAGGVLTVAAPGLLANDKDSDGDSLSVSVLNVTGLSGKGVIIPRADGSFTFTPNAGFAGDATFTYTINDGFGGNATATALVHVGNAAPVAVEDSYSVHVGRTLAVAAPGLLANDSDANGDPLQVTSLNVTGLQGTLSPFADGHFSFTPTAGFTGTTSFNYTISDGFGGTSTAKVNIDVFNNKPVVNNDTYNIRPNQVLSVAAPGLLANDSDPDGDTLSVVALDVSGLRGSITPFADGHFSFTPTVGFAGTTSFKYTVSDGAGGTATGTTTINVVNAAPVAVNDSYAMHTNKTLSIAAPGLLANDRDADGDPLQVTSLNVTGLQGTLSPFADGHFSFTPTAGFTGTTSFNYTISDGFGGTSTATVKIDVFNNKPVVNNDTYNIRPNEVLSVAAPGLLANDSDPDGDTLSVVALDVSGLRGSITPFTDGHFSFTPTTDFAGTTSFRYTVSDGAGGTATGTATINLVNSSPVAVNDRYAVYAGRTLEVAAPGLLGNDSDADGDALTAKLADVTGLQGSISLLADGHFIFTPKAGFTGRTSFSYTTSDGFGGTATATAAIDVVPIPTKTVSIGNAPDRQSGLGGQWAAAWTNADIVTSIVHKADYTNATETWSAVRLNGVSPQTLAGGDIYAGDLGVSGQSEASSPVRQEIDGKEALRFNLAESATGLTVYLSRLFTQDDGGDFVESGRLRLLDADGHVVKETSFHAGGAAGTQAITLTSDLAFSAIELSAGVYDGSTFVPGGYAHADGSFAATVTSDAVGVKHGSDFLVDKIDFQVPVLGVPLTDVFAP